MRGYFFKENNMNKYQYSLILLICLVTTFWSFESANATEVKASTAETLPIDAFAMLPVIRGVSVSPDGEKLIVVRASTKNGDYYIEIRDLKNISAKPVRLGADKMLVSGVSWLNNEKLLVSFRQILRDGSRSYWVNKFAIANADGKGKWLIPFRNQNNVSFSFTSLLPEQKDSILVEVDINRNGIPDVVKMNINTGRTTTVLRGNTKVSGGFIADKDGEVRAATGWNSADDAIDIFARKKGDDDWILLHQNSSSPKKRENYTVLGFSAEQPNQIYVSTNLGEDKTGIYIYDLDTKKYSERLFGLNSVDVDGATFNKWGKLISFNYTTKHPKFYFVDEAEKQLYDSVAALFSDKFVRIVSRSDDNNAIIIRTQADRDPGTYYLLSNMKKLEKIGESQPLLKPENLSDVKYVTYTTRDNRKTKAYVTVPNGKAPYPTVVIPHGGPWARDVNIFDEWAQLLAHHGYLVIQPQFRGSTGYGLEHWKAGDKNWGLTMQDDIDDAALYFVDKGFSQKDNLAVFGWSYGGYSAFAGSMRENNIYQCAIAGAGVSDLGRINATLNESIFLRELQRPTIAGISPVDHVDKVNIPILVVHGDIDIRVPIKHSEDFVEKLVEYNKQHKYVELEDADHFLDTLFYNHKTIFYTELLSFLENDCKLKS